MSTSDQRVLVIGAGFAGLGIAAALKTRDIAFEVVEQADDLGGNWYRGVYERTHIISSRDSTGFADFPMPRDYPDFPSREQVLDYLRAYAEHHRLRPHIRFHTRVIEARPLRPDGMTGWRVRLETPAGEEMRTYPAVAVCNGHHWDRRLPEYPGHFSGKTLHSKDYRNPEDFAPGPVLVVGAGNSGCDIAVEAARAGHETYVSMRRGYYFLPKTLFGVPTAEMEVPLLPFPLQKAFLKLMLRVAVGPNRRYGLPDPDHDLFDHHPIVNSELLYELRHGRIQARPDIDRLEGDQVRFEDGSSIRAGTIVWATGFNVSFPFLDRALFEWEDGIPKRVASLLPPAVANLYLFGLLQPRGGAGPLISAGAKLIAEMIGTQRQLDRPLAAELARLSPPAARMLVGVRETLRRIRVASLYLRWLRLRARRRPAQLEAA
ncbi:MAG TPA: NAD(P)-binding domain-containing protein [Candidatus Dormibacteraeota bacterium]